MCGFRGPGRKGRPAGSVRTRKQSGPAGVPGGGAPGQQPGLNFGFGFGFGEVIDVEVEALKD